MCQLEFTTTRKEDLPQVMGFFDAAILYQRARRQPEWPRFAPGFIAEEIMQGRHWKISDGQLTQGYFSVQYNDPVIWGERDTDPALYLHRIVANPELKGRGLMPALYDWALRHARKLGKQYVRMDTWGNNVRLRNYYTACGFIYIGQKQLQPQGQPAAHYGGNCLSLFENEV